MNDRSAEHTGAAEVVTWMMRKGRHMTHMREFGDEMCRRIVAARIPIWRAFCSVDTLHPQIVASAYIWRREEQGAVRRTAPHSFFASQEWTTSPIAELKRTGHTIRRRVCDPDCPMDFPVVGELRAEGGTDYIAMPMICSGGEINAISWATNQPGGFSEAEVEGLTAVADTLAIIVELQSTRRVARYLLDTYVGHRTGERVLSGAITRGSRETIHAVIWYSDLRGFTALTDSLVRDRVIDLLNEYFEIMVEAVGAEGGEALKFVGDAMLAIFELREGEQPSDRCAAALRAARVAIAKIAECNRRRSDQGEPLIRFGLALHLGEVSYGNIGAPSRLDFTVVGPAVNHAARLEKLAGEMNREVVTSASFAAASKIPMESLGRHTLRGIREPQEVFAPATLTNGSI
jgi:adenylate cyclase